MTTRPQIDQTILRLELAESLMRYGIPDSLHDGLIAYIVNGRPTGDFLRSVLSNNLKGAVAYADVQSEAALSRIVRFLYNQAPMDCWGSAETVAAWMEQKRKERDQVSEEKTI